jgi:predicted RNase H-like HicB family nuclease
LVVVERAERNYAAFSPDLPGCVATGRTKEETLRRMRAAIAEHIEGLRQDGLPIPEPSSSAEYVAI